jgi:hypothetical protein
MNWSQLNVVSAAFAAQHAPLDRKLLVVGDGPEAPFHSIAEAMDWVPWGLDEASKDHNWTDRYHILLLPGNYQEQVICKPFVTIQGVAKESVFLETPLIGDWTALSQNVPRAHIYLQPNVTISNVTVGIRAGSTTSDYSFFGRDALGVSLTNVNVAPFSKARNEENLPSNEYALALLPKTFPSRPFREMCPSWLKIPPKSHPLRGLRSSSRIASACT